MQYGEGKLGRVFALRLQDGDRLPEAIEEFAKGHEIKAALVFYLGGAGKGSRLVVGPEEDRGDSIIPIIFALSGIQEVLAIGTIFPDESGNPVLHMHAATGREGNATVGCTRAGMEVWLVGEVILIEITGTKGQRKKDPQSTFQLLEFPKPA